jgi:hypothetical protein
MPWSRPRPALVIARIELLHCTEMRRVMQLGERGSAPGGAGCTGLGGGTKLGSCSNEGWLDPTAKSITGASAD